MKKTNLIYLLMVFSTLSFLSSCDKNMNEHYQIPDWLKGNAWEVLEQAGQYKIFMEGIERSGYQSIVAGKSILTVMAPNDSAFTVYLQQKNYSSISEMPAAELKKLIGFHLMYYAFDWNKLVNFRPNEGDGATEEQKAVEAGYYYKFRTKSSDPVSKEWNAILGDTVSVYHYERFLPVFSCKMFETKGIDAKYNYEYFYPNSTWTGGNEGFNVSNASVQNADNVITDNGYLYYLNQVLDPLETIYTTLKNRYDRYSEYFDLYDDYSTYTLDQELTLDFGNGEDLYLHGHTSLPSIALEWPVNNYAAMATLSKESYNIFAPSNVAMNAFYNSYWKEGGYESIKDVDPLVLEYFILQSFSDEFHIVFPEEITKGEVKTLFGTPININPDDVDDRIMCVNGAFYGMDEMTAPAIFSSVAGPAFKYENYLHFLYALDGSDLLLALASQETDFVVLMPDTIQMGSKTDPPMRMAHLNSGNQLEILNEEGQYDALSSSLMEDIVNMHVVSGTTALATTGTKVYETNMAFNYWFVKDGMITTNKLFNQYIDPLYTGNPFVPFTEIKNGTTDWDNGRTYSYDGSSLDDALFKSDGGDGLQYSLAVCNDKTYPYYLFSKLMEKAGMINETIITFLNMLEPGTRFMLFVPTNDAITANISNIPGAEKLSVLADGSLSGTPTTSQKTELANYLKSYFIPSDLNSFTSYPYVGGGIHGDFDTYGNYGISLIDSGSDLSVKFKESEKDAVKVTAKYFYLPFAFTDGCFHLIDGILL